MTQKERQTIRSLLKKSKIANGGRVKKSERNKIVEGYFALKKLGMYQCPGS